MRRASIPLVVFGSMVVVPLAGQVEERIAWGDCATTANPQLEAECATVTMPLHHGETEPTIEVALMRIPASGERRRQLWFLDGGPGDPGTASVERLALLLEDPGLEILTFDHRGTGGSALLECPEQQAPDSPEGGEISREEWPACIEFIRHDRTDLDGLSATEVAHDLHELVGRLRVDAVPVFVLGISYGSYLAQRYLQLYPEQPDAVILDGIVPPDWGFDEFDAGLDKVGRRALDRCAGDSTCAARLGPEPVARLEQLLAKQQTGHCYPLDLQPSITRMVLGVGLMVDKIPPALLAAVVYRLDRCKWHDQMAMLHLFNNTFDSIEEASSHSPVLQRHISMSELWSADAPSEEELRVTLDGYVMTTEVSVSFAATAGSWPAYPRPENARKFAAYSGPMLMMHGSLDPTMPVERLETLQNFYVAPAQYFFVIPDAGHVVVTEGDCAVSIYRQFLEAPRVSPDTSCISDVAALDFTVAADDARLLLGTADLWGDRVPLLRSIAFFVFFRWGGLTIGVVGLFAGLLVWQQTRAPSGSRLLKALSLFGWSVFALVMWQALFFLPYLLPYVAAQTLTIALTALAVQAGLAWWMVRRLGSGGRFRLSGSQG